MRSINLAAILPMMIVVAVGASAATVGAMTLFDPSGGGDGGDVLGASGQAGELARMRGELEAARTRLAEVDARLRASEGDPTQFLMDRLLELEETLRVERAERATHDRRLEAMIADLPDPTSLGNSAGNGGGRIDGRSRRLMETVAREQIDAWQRELEEQREAERNAQIEQHLQQQANWMQRVYDFSLNRLTDEIALTPYQIDQVRDLMQWRKEQLLRNRDQRVPSDQRRSWDDVNTEYQESMDQILSDGQMQIYDEKGLGDFQRMQREMNNAGNPHTDR